MNNLNTLKALSNFDLDYRIKDDDIFIKKSGSPKSFKMLNFKKLSNSAINNLLFSSRNVFAVVNSILDSGKAQLLKKLDINFVDASGNCYINLNDAYIYNFHKSNKSRKPSLGPSPLKTVGIKYIYHLLKDPNFLSYPLEKSAQIAGISLGSSANLKKMTISNYLDDFDGLDTLKAIKDFTVSLNNLIKPKILLGDYYCSNPEKLLNDKRVTISGQHAVKHIKKSKNINPRHAHIYIDKANLGNVIFDYNLEKHTKKSNVVIFDNVFKTSEKYVPLFLAYADLTESKDPRDIELALEVLSGLQ